jgi:hypothetical protein
VSPSISFPDHPFPKNPHPSDVGIEVYNNEVVRNNIEGTFVSHSAEGDLPDGERGYANPTLPTTLISRPQVVFQHPKQDVVLSERHGCFMQPSSTSCPICHPNDKRINFNGGPAGFTLEIFPGHKPSMHMGESQFCFPKNAQRNPTIPKKCTVEPHDDDERQEN